MGYFNITPKPAAPAQSGSGSNPASGNQPTRTPSKTERPGGHFAVKPGISMGVPPGHMPIGSNSTGLKAIATPAGYSNLLRK
jgi:hypothetical protein